MNYIVLDLEWNQPLVRKKVMNVNIKLNGEIIQIGALKLNDRMEAIDEFSVIIKPKFYTKMSKEVSALTLISDEDINAGVPFEEAVAQFREWCGDDCALITWSSSDVIMLEENLIANNMDYEWIPECFDAQLMFDDLVTMEGRQYPLNYALFHFNIKPSGMHDALADAKSTAEIIRQMDAVGWIEEERMY